MVVNNVYISLIFSKCYLGPERRTAETLLQSDGPEEVPSPLTDLKKFE